MPMMTVVIAAYHPGDIVGMNEAEETYPTLDIL